MEIKAANQEYLEKAKHLTIEDAERLQLRMFGKLPQRLKEENLGLLAVLAIQLELEDAQLNDWRKHRTNIRANAKIKV